MMTGVIPLVAMLGWLAAVAAPAGGGSTREEALLRNWIQQDGPWNGPVSKLAGIDPVADWAWLLRMMEEPAGPKRNDDLQRLGRATESSLLRAQIIRVLQLDADQQGREALFVRRYGVFASGFNRVMYTGMRVIQGNIVAVGQLFVDATYGLIRPKQDTPLNRRLLAMEQQLAALKLAPITSPEEVERLEGAIDRSQSESDLRRAAWALEQGQPETALFFAKEAKRLRPESGKASRMVLDADSAIAAQRRHALGSGQAGFPDRQPPLELESAKVLRELLADRRGARGVMDALDEASAEAVNQGEPVGEMQALDAWLEDAEDLPEYERRWLAGLLNSPRHNPAEQLAQARDRARGNRLRYIFIGPESRDQHAYKAASWAVQSLEAVQTIGVFYAFEVVGRSVLVWMHDPTPHQDLRDALATNLRDVDQPDRAENQWARQWQRLLVEDGEFDKARDLARAYPDGKLKPVEKVNKVEAGLVADHILQLPASPERAAMLDKLGNLDPDKARKIEKRLAKAKENEGVRLWVRGNELAEAVGNLAAAQSLGIDPQSAYFVDIRQDEDGELKLSIRDARAGGEREIDTHSGALLPWAEGQYETHRDSRSMIDRYARRRIPVELQGGIGASGIDFYPRLVPIELRPEEQQFYRE